MEDFWVQLGADAAGQGVLDWLVTVTALAYIVLSVNNKPQAWYWSIVSSSLWAWLSYKVYQLYLDAILQVFYVLVALWGVYLWKYKPSLNGQQGLSISSLHPWQHVALVSLSCVLSVGLAWLFGQHTDAALPWLDAPVTIFSMLATLLLARRMLEHWLYWIVVDLVGAAMFAVRGASLLALVMVVYALLAIWGWRKWLVLYRLQKEGAEGGVVGEV
jgi:nicotinamide mononucleotide transporter